MEESRVRPQSGIWCFGRELNRDIHQCYLFGTRREFTDGGLHTSIEVILNTLNMMQQNTWQFHGAARSATIADIFILRSSQERLKQGLLHSSLLSTLRREKGDMHT